jgi:hypothetical protein
MGRHARRAAAPRESYPWTERLVVSLVVALVTFGAVTWAGGLHRGVPAGAAAFAVVLLSLTLSAGLPSREDQDADRDVGRGA